MGGGTLWRSVARAVGAAAPTVAVTANAAYCHACTATPQPRGAAAGCSCKTQLAPVPGLTAVSYGPQQFWDIDDWEIAGDEERDHYVFGSLPTVKEVEEASSDLQNALRLYVAHLICHVFENEFLGMVASWYSLSFCVL